MRRILLLGALATAFLAIPAVDAHGISAGDQAFIEANPGPQTGPFLYLGAKHMVTGYDHLLFLVGVIFFLYRTQDVLTYVTLFTIGHSTTLLVGVLADVPANPFLIDAVIGFSVVYKGFDNLGGFRTLLGFQPDTRAAVLLFGLFHGFGLSTKLQAFGLSQDGLVTNLVAFNAGVEIGQFLALAIILVAITWWRLHDSYLRFAFVSNAAIMAGGFMLIGYQLTGYFTT